MAGEIGPRATDELIERVIVGGDLAALSPAQRTEYYRAVCESLGLNPLTRPFDYIRLQGRLTLYARRDAADQLRRQHGVSVEITSRAKVDGLYVVSARATDASGRVDESIGAVSVDNLSGEALANALMKAETKAKRRVTLSICGLGWSDETEVETIPNAQPVVVNEDGLIDQPETVVEPAPKPSNGYGWINDDNSRAKFWAWTGDLGLTHAQVHEACGVESMKDYTGSKADAVAAINAYIEAQMAAEAQEG